ncbi:MAG: hypothetical protein NTU98_09070 [Bacteroidetes bacterium]|nr:hypothetical protein [Bacteroidota bacterium]
MKQRREITFLIIFSVSLFSQAFPQANINQDHFINLFNQQQYVQVFKEASDLRQKKEYAKTAVLDYFMAKSVCATGNYSGAKRIFSYIIAEYSLNKSQKQFMINEMNACMQAEFSDEMRQQIAEMNYRMMSQQNLSVATVAGKQGYVINCQVDTAAYKVDEKFDRKELSKRLFPVDSTDKAVSYFRQFLAGKYNVYSSGRYIIVTTLSENLSTSSISWVTTNLNKAYDFFWKFYGVRPPDKLISVYLMPDKPSLQELSKRIHGLILPESNIGYSSIGDLSILGISGPGHIGTIYHELFHLMVRTDVGDIPGWLDEGVACLYETSHWKGDTLKGDIDNWRMKVIREYIRARKTIPTLSQIVHDNWDCFAFTEYTSPCTIAMNYALVKHLAIYFQEHGLLGNVVGAFKNRTNIYADSTYNQETDTRILENALGTSMDSLQRRFDRWLDSTYQIRSHSKTSGGASGFSYKYVKNQLRDAADFLKTKSGKYPPEDPINKEFEKLIKENNSLTAEVDDLYNKALKESGGIQRPIEVKFPESLKSRLQAHFQNTNQMQSQLIK